MRTDQNVHDGWWRNWCWRSHSSLLRPNGRSRCTTVGREKPAVHTVAQPQAAARLQAVLNLIEAHKRKKWSLPAGVRTVVSYEAGQDAFWICPRAAGATHRVLRRRSGSIPVERHQRRRQDRPARCIKLVIKPACVAARRRDRMHVVHVPSPQDEASRQLMRDRGELQKEVQRIATDAQTAGHARCWVRSITSTSPAGSPVTEVEVPHRGGRCRPNCASGCCAVQRLALARPATRGAREDAAGERARTRAQAKR